MYISAASCPSCPVCPLRTRRTCSFLTPWEICLLPHSLANITTHQATRGQSTMSQRGRSQQPTGDSLVFLGLPLCPVTHPATPQALRRSLTDHVAWDRTRCFSPCLWGGSSSLRGLWTLRSARPPAHAAHGDALTPTTLQRCVFVTCVCYCLLSCCLFL